MSLARHSQLRRRVLSAHLASSTILIAALSSLIMTYLYPDGLVLLQGGKEILLWVGVVTLVLGPLLTFILFRPDTKGRRELALDLALILILQLGAFGYGTWVLSVQRPTYLAFLYDRFFVITSQDIVGAVPTEVESVSPWSKGPYPVFVKLSLRAQLEAARTITTQEEAPAMALLPGGYAQLAEGRSRFEQIRDSGEAKPPVENGVLWVQLIGRGGRMLAAIELSTGELLRIKK